MGQIMKIADFSACTNNNGIINEKSFLGKKTILFFYPKDMTPGCTKEACGFRDAYDEIISHGYNIYGVSKDSVASHNKFIAKHNLPFELISDDKNQLCSAFNVWQEKSMFGKKYMGIVRSTFIINDAGLIIKSWPKVSVTNHVSEVLAWIKTS